MSSFNLSIERLLQNINELGIERKDVIDYVRRSCILAILNTTDKNISIPPYLLLVRQKQYQIRLIKLNETNSNSQ